MPGEEGREGFTGLALPGTEGVNGGVPPAADPNAPLKESELLKEAGLEGKFGNIDEALAAAAEATAYKEQLAKVEGMARTYSSLARELGYSSIQAMVDGLKAGKAEKDTSQKPTLRPKMEELFKKHGGKDEDKALVDFMTEALEQTIAPYEKTIKDLQTGFVAAQDERALDRFLQKPENAKLSPKMRSVLKDVYYKGGFYNAPEGHAGEWDLADGVEAAYRSFVAQMKELGLSPEKAAETTPARPATRRPGTSGMMSPAPSRRIEATPPSHVGDLLDKVPALRELMDEKGSIHPLKIKQLRESMENPTYGG